MQYFQACNSITKTCGTTYWIELAVLDATTKAHVPPSAITSYAAKALTESGLVDLTAADKNGLLFSASDTGYGSCAAWAGSSSKSGRPDPKYFAGYTGTEACQPGDIRYLMQYTKSDTRYVELTINGSKLLRDIEENKWLTANPFSADKNTGSNVTVAKVKAKAATAGKAKVKVTWTKLASSQQVTAYQVRYKVKGASKWTKTVSAKASASSYTITKLKKGKVYQVQVRAVRKITSGTSKGTYYGAWSSTKTSKKVK
ncbi:MAG: fibronectin type III domain-containing protein [Propionibacteriaceae bacterium]|nr:fibronectin type III domain-containing protein [Propionibacteriaceae bacterium]